MIYIALIKYFLLLELTSIKTNKIGNRIDAEPYLTLAISNIHLQIHEVTEKVCHLIKKMHLQYSFTFCI